MKSLLVGIKNVLLWSYARGTWQYDALCLGIVLAVFLVPSRYFGDRDRVKPKQANEVARQAPKAGEAPDETYIKADALDQFWKEQNRTELSRTLKEAMQLYLQDMLKKNVKIIDIKHYNTPDGKVIYKVWFK